MMVEATPLIKKPKLPVRSDDTILVRRDLCYAQAVHVLAGNSMQLQTLAMLFRSMGRHDLAGDVDDLVIKMGQIGFKLFPGG